jgi:hypothetical protein
MNTHTRYLTAPKSSAEKRWDRTTWVRDMQTGYKICAFDGRRHTFDVVRDLNGGTVFAWTSVTTGDAEGVEYITADGVPVAWIDEPPHSFSTDEIHAALFPQQIAAE